MKFQPDRPTGMNIIHAATRTAVSINGTTHQSSVLVPGDAPLEPWPPARIEDLTEAHFNRILEFRPEVVVFGSGATLRFAHPKLMRRLLEAGIGVETMDTPAACRTYNVLMSEGRRTLAALIIAPD